MVGDLGCSESGAVLKTPVDLNSTGTPNWFSLAPADGAGCWMNILMGSILARVGLFDPSLQQNRTEVIVDCPVMQLNAIEMVSIISIMTPNRSCLSFREGVTLVLFEMVLDVLDRFFGTHPGSSTFLLGCAGRGLPSIGPSAMSVSRGGFPSENSEAR